MAAKRKYPWELWFGSPRVVLTRGVDYHIAQSIMYQTIRNNAGARNLRVRITDTGDGMVIEVIGEKSGAILHPVTPALAR